MKPIRLVLPQVLLFCFSGLTTVNVFDGRLTLSVLSVQAQSRGSQGYDIYSSRPSIQAVASKPMKNKMPGLAAEWTALKRAQFAAAVEILALYPDREIYFLGRDAEMIFDAAVLISSPHTKSQLHLINVSRGNVLSPHLTSYLAEHGITNQSLSRGQKVLFVDTGFAGTIPKRILSHFPDYTQQFKTHLMVSDNSEHPSTRTFVIELNPAANEMDLSAAHGTIVGYEHLPRYTDRSSEYHFINGRWEAVSANKGQQDGAIDKAIALSFMQDLKYSWENDRDLVAFVRSHQTHWKQIKSILEQSNNSESTKSALIRFLKAKSDLRPDRRESMIRDLFEARINDADMSHALSELDVTDLGLAQSIIPGVSIKHQLAEKHPEWAALLANPETEVPKSLIVGDYKTLGAILDVLPDADFRSIVIRASSELSGNFPLRA